MSETKPVGNKNEKVGSVVSTKMAKTIIVEVTRRVPHAVDRDRPPPHRPPGATEQRDPVRGEPVRSPGIRPLAHHEIPPRERSVDIDVRVRLGVACCVDRLARPQQRLRRDARPVGAFAPDEITFDDRDLRPSGGERAGAVLPRRSRAQHDDVEVRAHRGAHGRPPIVTSTAITASRIRRATEPVEATGPPGPGILTGATDGVA